MAEAKSKTAEKAETGTPAAEVKAAAAQVEKEGGVPMLPGDPSEPSGPEDALGKGPKRGDYSQVMRLEAPHETVVNPDHDPADPASPRYVLESQAPRVDEVGDVPGKKGGVDTAESAK